jgi:hypothetical protein
LEILDYLISFSKMIENRVEKKGVGFMDKSFHYYCIRVLAEKAGFPGEAAQTIAYASQYTDDATEHGKINVAGIPKSFSCERWDPEKGEFDPICTAHAAKSWMSKLWKWAKFYLKADVQRKILMPFHFIPPEGLRNGDAEIYNYVTQKNSPLANLVLDTALQRVKNASKSSHLLALIKLGIALHLYADSWAHDGFSGRHNAKENDLKRIRVEEDGQFKAVDPLATAVSYAAPDVGHSEAGSLPDETNKNWKAKYANQTGSMERSNTVEFLDAAETIYGKLMEISPGQGMEWKDLSAKIGNCFNEAGAWDNTFPEIDFEYNRYTWRAAALTGDSVKWDNFDEETDFHKLKFKYTRKDMRWFLFHKAAHAQRVLLANKIPKAWMNG